MNKFKKDIYFINIYQKLTDLNLLTKQKIRKYLKNKKMKNLKEINHKYHKKKLIKNMITKTDTENICNKFNLIYIN